MTGREFKKEDGKLPRYRIAWKSNITGFTGHGDWYDSFELINEIKVIANEKHLPDIEHWVEDELSVGR